MCITVEASAQSLVLPIISHLSGQRSRQVTLAFAGTVVRSTRSGLHTAPSRVRVLRLGPECIGGAMDRLNARVSTLACLATSAAGDATMTREFHELLDFLQCSSGAADCSSRRLEAVTQFLSRILTSERAPTSPKFRDKRVINVWEFLRRDVTRSFELRDLVGVAGVGRFHLLRLFETATGMTPRSFQLQLRAARAMAMITAGTPLSRVTFEAGFADQSHLIRRFKEVFGMTPGAARRRLLALDASLDCLVIESPATQLARAA